MEETYQDPVNRTFELYSLQISEALAQLKQGSPNFGRYEIKPGQYAEAKFNDAEGLQAISFTDAKMLENEVKRITGDSKVKLLRTLSEFLHMENAPDKDKRKRATEIKDSKFEVVDTRR